MIGYFSAGIGRIPHLAAFLDAPCAPVRKVPRDRLTHIAGWGLKPTADKARCYAQRKGLPYLSLEDGFLRSLGLGVNGARRHSLVVDHTGIYYDATRPSDLETLIRDGEFSADELARARDCMAQIRRYRLSKYNHAPDRPWLEAEAAPAGEGGRILVVDQTAGDASIEHGLADASAFTRMLEAAIADNPGAEVVVKTHPDVLAGKKRGHLTELARRHGCRVVAEDLSPWALLDAVDQVYVVTSQLGFEALMAGRPVRCFGMPFYAGWGLTRDELTCVRRGRQRPLEALFAAAYLRYSRYINPYTGRACALEDTIDLLADQKRVTGRFRGDWVGVGFSWNKRRFLGRFLGPAARLRFVRGERALRRMPVGTRVLAWASAVSPGFAARCHDRGHALCRVEDGFVRSVGLGVDLIDPLSLVVDGRGIYYDGTRPSELEERLNTAELPADLVARAGRLRHRLVAQRLSKYNVGGAADLDLPAARRIILVPGQVETDASIATGAAGIATNQQLLATVRAENPEAFILYKPHPDVVAGGRVGGEEEAAGDLCDGVVTAVGMPYLLERVDEVHTITSLTGFEALLRGLRVVTYGSPFYAGWGLTVDRVACPRRIRRRSLDELVAATLILYSVYADPLTGELINAETAVDLLALHRREGERLPFKSRLYRIFRQRF